MVHSFFRKTTLTLVSNTSYIRRYIRRCRGSIGLGHWHSSNFFVRVMVILSRLHHAHHRFHLAHWKSHLHHLRHHPAGKHLRHHPHHVVGRSTMGLLVDPVHHRHAAACTLSEHYDLLQQTSEKTNDCRDSVTVIATLITAMFACQSMILHVLRNFEIVWDISRFFEIFWAFGTFKPIAAFTFLLTPRDFLRYFEIFRDISRNFEIFRDFFFEFFLLFFFAFYVLFLLPVQSSLQSSMPLHISASTCTGLISLFPLPLRWGSIN